MEIVRKGLRALSYAGRWIRSWFLSVWYRSLYSDLRVGRRVHFGRGVYLRITKGGSLTIGDDVWIEPNTMLVAEGDLQIGARSFIGTGSIIAASKEVRVGADALIAAYVTVRDQEHRFDVPGKSFRAQGLSADPVQIGDNVWLGTKATILKGVTIGSNSIIGANSVVRTSIASGSIAAGIPAKVVKNLIDEQSPPRSN
jgi:acetyltransferase-like isoleucine patch superfamily enzyme